MDWVVFKNTGVYIATGLRAPENGRFYARTRNVADHYLMTENASRSWNHSNFCVTRPFERASPWASSPHDAREVDGNARWLKRK